MSNRQRLTRSHDRWISGVCGGIAEFVGWRPAVVRMLWVLGSILFTAGFGGIVMYTILAFVMPPPDQGGKFRLDDFRVQ